MQIDTPKTPEEIIIKASANHFGLDVQHFTERKDNDYNAIYQRQLCLFIIKEKTLISFKKTGTFFNLSESAVKSSVYKIRDLITVDRRTKDDFKEIQSLINKFTEQKRQHYA